MMQATPIQPNIAKPMYCKFHRKPYQMRVSKVTNKDGSVDIGLTCPKCFQYVPLKTQEIKPQLVTG